MTSGTASRRQAEHQQRLEELRQIEARTKRRRRRFGLAAWAAGFLVVATLVTVALLSSRPVVSAETRQAPGFTLPTSDGQTVSLSSFLGEPVILYFNEGAGCDACLQQMAEIEKEPGFAAAGITVLPIVMNTAEQINADRDRLGVATPFLLDDGKISKAYGTLGTGMHEGLPGHGFVLIDADGVQQWYGNYPSMWLEPKELLDEATSRL
ncbi:peroxiredoxin family protein [Cellulomonas humilata]|uniref:Peroxiredoxin family protein n=1 Tax=Cellulomonas humilata TaxID=144055 RepID=A0A7Y5ZZI5_9CELL|nr:peroxiredoxin family protein [Cellulomonas humilata]NUU17021.1 peroxiredoxin family protein [Cellulomonas humilata]